MGLWIFRWSGLRLRFNPQTDDFAYPYRIVRQKTLDAGNQHFLAINLDYLARNLRIVSAHFEWCADVINPSAKFCWGSYFIKRRDFDHFISPCFDVVAVELV